jgi:hypothetical protein
MPINKEHYFKLTQNICDLFDEFEKGAEEVTIEETVVTLNDVKLLIRMLKRDLMTDLRKLTRKKEIEQDKKIEKIAGDRNKKPI